MIDDGRDAANPSGWVVFFWFMDDMDGSQVKMGQVYGDRWKDLRQVCSMLCWWKVLSTSFHIFPHLSTSNVTNFWSMISMMWCPLPHGTSSSSSPMENPWNDHVSLPEWSQNGPRTKTWPSAWSGQRWRFSKTMSLAEWGQRPGNLSTWTVPFAFRSFQSAWESNVVPKYHDLRNSKILWVQWQL
jgi:hypothetical protein